MPARHLIGGSCRFSRRLEAASVAPKPSFSNSGYEFLDASGERSFASIKIPGLRRRATVAASFCWREGGSS